MIESLTVVSPPNAAPKPVSGPVELLIGTRKGAFILRSDIIDEQDRIREHINILVNQDQAKDLRIPLHQSDEIQIICALSGG